MPTRTPTTSTANSLGPVLVQVARDRPSQLVFVLTGLVAFVVYGTVLPSDNAGGQLTLANWAYLDGILLAFSLVLSLGLATVLTLQIYALRQALLARRAAGGQGAVGGLGFLTSLVPSLCCSPVLPAVLALFGVGASGATATMKTIAPYRTLVLIAALALFAALAWWSTRRIARDTAAATGRDCC